MRLDLLSATFGSKQIEEQTFGSESSWIVIAWIQTFGKKLHFWLHNMLHRFRLIKF